MKPLLGRNFCSFVWRSDKKHSKTYLNLKSHDKTKAFYSEERIWGECFAFLEILLRSLVSGNSLTDFLVASLHWCMYVIVSFSIYHIFHIYLVCYICFKRMCFLENITYYSFRISKLYIYIFWMRSSLIYEKRSAAVDFSMWKMI